MVSKIIKKVICISFILFSANEVFAQASIDNLDQNADQSQGNYMPMNMGYAGFNSIGMTQSAWLDPLQNLGEGQSKPAYSKYYWSPDLVLPIRVREGMLTLINFPDWELVEDIYIGDNATFDGQISGPNTILLYPRKGSNIGVDTNIIIFGRSGNRYAFYIKSEGVNTERLTNSIIDVEVIDSPSSSSGGAMRGGGLYGSSGVNASKYRGGPNKSLDSNFTKRYQKEDWIKSIPLDPSKMRFDIEVYVPNPEDVIIAPERVWRDDIFTYIDLGEKALNMTQRPIVSLIVERMEVPVGFRTSGPNNRLIIVEGIGDIVMHNGKRIVCLKMRRSDDAGLELQTYATDFQDNTWDVPPPLPGSAKGGSGGNGGGFGGDRSFGGNGGNGNGGAGAESYGAEHGYSPSYRTDSFGSGYGNNDSGNGGNNGSVGSNYGNISGAGAFDGIDYSKMQRIGPNGKRMSSPENLSRYGYGSGFNDSGFNISIELGTDANVSNLETLWTDLSGKYSEVLSPYEPFYSVDTPADGQGKELFHLRIGPVKTLDEGDGVCSRLGRNGVFCSVIRTQ